MECTTWISRASNRMRTHSFIAPTKWMTCRVQIICKMLLKHSGNFVWWCRRWDAVVVSLCNDNNYAILTLNREETHRNLFQHTKTTKNYWILNTALRFCHDFNFRYYCFLCVLTLNIIWCCWLPGILYMYIFFCLLLSFLQHAVTSHTIVRMENDAEQFTGLIWLCR